ncbi:MAG: ATP-binding protein [bacterium]
MSNETRINLKHLLEDIRDGYTSPVEEVIITELIANALDSCANRIDFYVDPITQKLTCVDNGKGMTRSQFREYHNIASSSKVRGQGIGFAGVGAKLALLIADFVISETRGPRKGRCASEWRMSGNHKAPWKYVPSSSIIPHTRGTAVNIQLPTKLTNLLDINFVKQTIIKHFYPLLNQELNEKIFTKLYKKKIEFYINNIPVSLPENLARNQDEWFEVHLGKQRRPIGYGFLAMKEASSGWLHKITQGKPIPLSLSSGLTISTYGKVIKSGWEWIGLNPKSSFQLVGLVEIPTMAELLTTNKDGFLSDVSNLKKYYRFRKAIQEAVVPILRKFGEEEQPVERQTSREYIKSLSKQIENALDGMMENYPELGSVISAHSAMVNAKKGSIDKDNLQSRPKGLMLDEHERSNKKTEKNDNNSHKISLVPDEQGGLKKKVSHAGLKIVLEEFPETNNADSIPLGRIMEDFVYINTAHPIWKYSSVGRLEQYHISIITALLLYDFVAVGENPHEFLSAFLKKLSEQQDQRSLF